VIPFLITLVASLIAAFAALLGIVGITSLDDDRAVAATALVIAVLALYAAALFARAAIRINRSPGRIDPATRHFTYEYAVIATVGGFTLMWLGTGSIALGLVFIFLVLAVVALAAGRDFEPPR
jgi:hypothetical protein